MRRQAERAKEMQGGQSVWAQTRVSDLLVEEEYSCQRASVFFVRHTSVFFVRQLMNGGEEKSQTEASDFQVGERKRESFREMSGL